MLLGIDEGTSAVKAVLFDDDLTPIREARREKRTTHPQPGWVQQDAEEILGAVVAVAGEALGGERVAAVGLDHQGESVVAWDPIDGRPLSPVISWQDKRGAALLESIDVTRTGLPADPYFSASKVAWLLRNGVPPSARIGTVDSFLSDRLGAGFATDSSTASRTLLNVPGEPLWDAELLAAFGIPVEVLPSIDDTCGELGELRGIGPLRARCCDQQAALAGAGCVEPGMVKATYGTGVFVLAHAGTERPHASGLLPTVAWRTAGARAPRVEYALDGGVFTAGALVDWLAGLLGTSAGAFLADAAADAGGVRILPALAGLGAPWWRPDATGVIAGLTRGSGRPQLARAVLEAIAWRVADVLAKLEVAELRVDGGLTRSDALLAIQADVAGVVVRRGPPDATARGAAALAAVGAGLLADTHAIAALTPAGAAIEPRTDAPSRRAGHDDWRRFVRSAAPGA